MRRFGFRRILPLVFTAIHSALVLMGTQQMRAVAGSPHAMEYHRVAYQEGGGTMTAPLHEPAPLEPLQKFAILLDMPACVISVPIMAFLFPRSEIAGLYLSIPMVPFLWYGIGRWLDGILGYSRRLHLQRTLRSLISIPAAGLLCVSVAILTPLYHHRTADSYWIGTGMMLWSALSLAIAFSTKKID